MREYVNDGTVTAFALWNPGDLGNLAAYAADALVDGDITGEEGDSFTAGDLGDYTVDADATVLLGDPFMFNSRQHRRLRLLSRRVSGRLMVAEPAGDRHGRNRRVETRSATPLHHPHRPRKELRAARLLPAPGPSRTGIAEYRPGTPRSGPTWSGRCTRPAGTTTPCSCARTAC